MKNTLLFFCLFVLSASGVMAQTHRDREPLEGLDTISILIGLVVGVIIGYLIGSRMAKK
ncbi:hypothetical protein GCM10027275_35390 [Rhabdobacter roseus]|uniref:Putative membrane protein YfcA n=1 Tax=Rhabdobacter roseus TaxID=1655419 RepID=A0A840U025_9BACT|nr:hypothetical protein [Rhabdobacter roseus]MBB5285239.1 putative membrane protein YfcA [Rhabdobacter roseus]